MAPSLAVLSILVVGAAVACANGAPVWVFYAVLIVGAFIVAPSYSRWDLQHFPSRGEDGSG